MAFIKIDKKFKEWRYKKSPNMVAIWLHLLLEANYKDNVWDDVDIPRGSLVTSVKKISENTGLSIQQTRTCLSNLQKTNEITMTTTNKYTIITINKWDEYQSNGKNQQTNQQGNQINSNNQITNNLTTLKEYKEYKNKEYIEEDISRGDEVCMIIDRYLEAGYTQEDILTTIAIFSKCGIAVTQRLFSKVMNIVTDKNILNKDGYAYTLFKTEGIIN